MFEIVGLAVTVLLLVAARRVLNRMMQIARVLRDELRFSSEDVRELDHLFEAVLQDAA